MNINKALRRERKRAKRQHGMQVDNKNIFILEQEKKKKADWAKRRREKESGYENT